MLDPPALPQCGLWAAGEPNNNAGASDAIITATYGWLLDDVPASLGTPCIACERSRCTVGVDCLPYNLLRMEGDFYPNCTCHCVAGATGDRCEWPLRVDIEGRYTTEYQYLAVPGGVSGSGTNANVKCNALGAGWNLATFPTVESLRRYREAIAAQWAADRTRHLSWVALAWRAGDTFVWTAGRPNTLAFSVGADAARQCLNVSYTAEAPQLPPTVLTHCPWADGHPAANPSQTQTCGYLHTADASQTYMRIYERPCADLLYSAVCERTVCEVRADCEPDQTERVDGVWPNCVCHCKPFASGKRCEQPLRYDFGPYASEHWRVCDASNKKSQPDAAAACAAMGPGFGLAAFPGVGAWQRYVTLTKNDAIASPALWSTTWAGIISNDTAGRVWVFASGRLRGALMTTGWHYPNPTAVCSAVAYPSYDYAPLLAGAAGGTSGCGWQPNQPDSVQPCIQLRVDAGFQLEMDNTLCEYILPCAVCERSPCRMGTDCYEPNTAYMNTSAYFPNCACVCKEGAWGAKCEWPLQHDFGAAAYASEYSYECGAAPVGWADADSLLCKGGRGAEWHLATFPTAASHAAFLERGKATMGPAGLPVWVSATTIGAASANAWRWAHGRHANRTFYTGRAGSAPACVAYSYAQYRAEADFSAPAGGGHSGGYAFPDANPFPSPPLSSPPYDADTASTLFGGCGMWAAGQPSNTGDTNGQCAALQPSFGHALDDVPCEGSALSRCAACERSRCDALRDCYGPNTISVSPFAPCECRCRPGAYGRRCQFPIVVVHAYGAYTSEYAHVCDASGMRWNASGAREALCGAALRQEMAATLGWSGGTETERRVAVEAAVRGMDLATFPSAEATAAFLRGAATVPPAPSFVGARGAPSAANVWQWVSGRLSSVNFFSGLGSAPIGDGCLGFSLPNFLESPSVAYTYAYSRHCPWRAGMPNAAVAVGATDGAALWAPAFPSSAFLNSDGSFDVVAYSGAASHQCAVCERSPCSYTIDCYEPNTAYMNTSAYYPNCACVCKEGAWGAKCEWPLAVTHRAAIATTRGYQYLPNGAGSAFATITEQEDTGGADEGVSAHEGPFGYVSEYQYHCEEGQLWGYAAAAAVCARRGAEWHLATFPSTDSFARFRRQLLHSASSGQEGEAWVGGKTDKGLWRWTAGRLAGAAFYKGRSGIGECLNATASSVAARLSPLPSAPLPPPPGPPPNVFDVNFTFSDRQRCKFWSISHPTSASEAATAAAPYCAHVWSSGKWWIGERPCEQVSGGPAPSPPAPLPRCVACERTRCHSIGADCVPENTLAHAGPAAYAPNCCVCRAGKKGVACELDATRTVSPIATATASAEKSLSASETAAASITDLITSTASASLSVGSASASALVTESGSETAATPTHPTSHTASPSVTADVSPSAATDLRTPSALSSASPSLSPNASSPTVSVLQSPSLSDLPTASEALPPSRTVNASPSAIPMATASSALTESDAPPASATPSGPSGAASTSATVDARERTPIPPEPLPAPTVENGPGTNTTLEAVLFGAAAVPQSLRSQTSQCTRMERLIAPIGLLAPLRLLNLFPDDADDDGDDAKASRGGARLSYAAALAVSGAALAVAAILGALSILAGRVLWGTVPGHGRFASACAAVSFPATLIQTFVFLANGAAVSAGMVLGGGYDHSTDGAVPAAAGCCALLIVVPAAAAVATEVCAPSSTRRLARAAVDGADGRRFVLCRVAVRPAVAAEALGPAVGDLRIAAYALAPFFPFAVPLMLLVASAAVSASGRCPSSLVSSMVPTPCSSPPSGRSSAFLTTRRRVPSPP